MNPKNHILTLLEHGLSFNTISNLNDLQIKVLSEKFSKKEENKEAQDIQTKIRRFSSSEVSNAKTKGESLPGVRAFKLNADGSGSNLSVFKAEGGNGTLFEVTDQLSGSLFSVNTIAGIPILEVFSNNRLVAGQYGSNALVISGSKVGIGLATPLSNKSLSISGDAQVLGSFTKASGTFLIDHPDPAKLGWKLQHSFVESPTVGDNIYRYVIDIDNTLSGSIELPSYWKFLNESPQIWISPVKHFGVAYGELNEELSIMNVYANNVGKYNVLLIGTRKDPTIKRLMPEFNVEFESQ